ncbi:uncharacterized protein LOC116801116 [Drosophila sechellia]|uniref:uncharacterized protein LOC116801116 n=1 Tax=Drosophila sechellia TaxID=7238 RepID=UPI0013DE7481|nr:uncharacterized protein LOC116801116 [Drosophila sechellia]
MQFKLFSCVARVLSLRSDSRLCLLKINAKMDSDRKLNSDSNENTSGNDELPGSSSNANTEQNAPGAHGIVGREYFQNNNDQQKKELFVLDMKSKFLFLNKMLEEHESYKDMIDKRKGSITAMRDKYAIEIAELSKTLNDECALASQSSSVSILESCGLKSKSTKQPTEQAQYENGNKYKELRLAKLKEELRLLDSEISNLNRCIEKRHQAASKLKDNIGILYKRVEPHI